MTPEEFVSALELVVRRDVHEGTLADLRKPPGRRPRQGLVAAGEWYRGLDLMAQAFVSDIVAMSAVGTLVTVLSVLDGERVVEPAGEKSTFELVARKAGEEWPLVGPGTPMLHDLLADEWWTR